MNRCVFGIKAIILLCAALAPVVGCPAPAAAITIDFENEPALPVQPNNFAAAGAMQTYSRPGVYNISGGVVLGNPVVHQFECKRVIRPLEYRLVAHHVYR